jgi:arylformamidase
MAQFIDLSHTIEHGMVTYKGLPAPLICDFLSREDSHASYAADTEFQIGKLELIGNTGTYLDSPFHRYSGGKDLAKLDLSCLAALEGIVVRVPESVCAIDETFFIALDVTSKAILVQTGWDKYWRTDKYFEGHPHLTEAAAKCLKDKQAALVGIDSFNIDDISNRTRPVHTILLGAEIPIVEHMTNLKTLPSEGFKFYAVPPKISGFGTFPVRAFAQVY